MLMNLTDFLQKFLDNYVSTNWQRCCCFEAILNLFGFCWACFVEIISFGIWTPVARARRGQSYLKDALARFPLTDTARAFHPALRRTSPTETVIVSYCLPPGACLHFVL